MKFKETLPPSCPPIEVKPPSNPTLWRLVGQPSVNPEDFQSHAARFPLRTYSDPCKARAVSLITSLEACRSLTKLPSPNVRGLTHAAEVKCDQQAGVYDHNGPTHVSFWLASHVDPLTLVCSVEAL